MNTHHQAQIPIPSALLLRLQRQRVAVLMPILVLVSCVWSLPPVFGQPAKGLPTSYQPGNQAILKAFDSKSIVALAMPPLMTQWADFVLGLIQTKEFPSRVNDIMIEHGNALYQDLCDRYTEGDEVPGDVLAQIWRNTTMSLTGPSRLGPGDWTFYPQLLKTVREINRNLPHEQHLRVLLGDPPIDWKQVRRRADYAPFLAQRDTFPAEVLVQEVLQKRRKAMVLYGGYHILHKGSFLLAGPSRDLEQLSVDPAGPPSNGAREMGTGPNAEGSGVVPFHRDSGPGAPGQTDNKVVVGLNPAGLSITELVERKYPGCVYVILVHYGFSERNSELEKHFAGQAKGTILEIRGSWMEALPSATLFPSPKLSARAMATLKAEFYEGQDLKDLFNGYLYLGQVTELQEALLNPSNYRGEYFDELNRRNQILFGEPFHPPR